jgi:YD repeat-containing protein
MSDFPVRLFYSATNGFQFVLSRGDDYLYDLTLSSGAVTAGQWYHVVAVYRQNGQCELWVNGAMVASQTIGFTITGNSRNWKLANATENTGGTDIAAFSGMLADAAIYGTALSGARIQAHYAANGTGNLKQIDYPDGTSEIYHYENTAVPHQLTGVSYREANSATSRYSTFAYDSNGKAHSTEHAGGAESFTFAYGSATQTTVTDAGGTAELNSFGSQFGVNTLRSQVNQVDGKSLTQTFDSNNNLTCRKDAEGHLTTYAHNASNQRTSMIEGRAGTCTSPTNTAVTRTTSFAYLS